MTTYYLRLNNHFQDGEFYFFTQPPAPGSSPTDTFTNTWIQAAVPKGSGYEQIQATMKFYAWCGTSPIANPTIGTVIQGGETEPVVLGVSGGSAGTTWDTKTLNGSTLEFVPAPATGDAGSFEIDTGTDFTPANNFMIGMAMPDPLNPPNVVPVSTWLALPNAKTNIAPVVMFYVAFGSSVQGEILDYNTISATSGVWDFSPNGPGDGMTYGEITCESNGTFSPTKYLPKPPGSDKKA